ncbi:LysR family transcriptional regulator substrate-binding protein [Streptomyces sp. B3I7]|uniref:LysR family transcriptional regulator substrate-binding protein n=1 Tax=Streptomyces sp. B3I7 TaxID=3042269 RepID=UPI0027D7F9AD|nr:LysR family transcriptional regulator substrate-binding protein [Streptomyces sp. B3I7]
MLRAWRRRHPEVAITLHELAVMDEALRLIESDEVDVAVLPDPPSDRFQVTAIAEEEIVLAAPASHPLAQRASVRIQDLNGAPLVHYTAHNRLGAWLDQSLARAGVHPEVVMRTSVTATAPQLAAAGLGIAVCPVSAVSAGFPGVIRPFSPRWTRQLMAVTSANTDPLVARFIAGLRRRGSRVPHSVQTQLDESAVVAGE